MKNFKRGVLFSLVFFYVSFYLTNLSYSNDLFEATTNNDLIKVKQLLQNGVDFNFKDKDGMTALMAASFDGYFEIAEFLIKSGADVNIKDESGGTALSWASETGQLDIADLLLRSGSDINLKDKDGRTPLIIASGSIFTEGNNNFFNYLNILINNGAKMNIVDIYGRNALSYAIETGNVGNVKLLLKNNADVKNISKEGETLFSFARKKEIIDLLFSYGAKPNLTGKPDTRIKWDLRTGESIELEVHSEIVHDILYSWMYNKEEKNLSPAVFYESTKLILPGLFSRDMPDEWKRNQYLTVKNIIDHRMRMSK